MTPALRARILAATNHLCARVAELDTGARELLIEAASDTDVERLRGLLGGVGLTALEESISALEAELDCAPVAELTPADVVLLDPTQGGDVVALDVHAAHDVDYAERHRSQIGDLAAAGAAVCARCQHGPPTTCGYVCQLGYAPKAVRS